MTYLGHVTDIVWKQNKQLSCVTKLQIFSNDEQAFAAKMFCFFGNTVVCDNLESFTPTISCSESSNIFSCYKNNIAKNIFSMRTLPFCGTPMVMQSDTLGSMCIPSVL